jgi:hypothetical protein
MSKALPVGIVLCTLLATACTWVETTPGGEKVRVLDADEVTSCKKLGTTTSALKDKIAGVNRSAEKVKKELETLARNTAADLGGDTVVATSEVLEGRQTFTVYRCVGAAP